MTAARLVLDASRCDGHGLCALLCSERISLDEWGFAAVDRQPIERPGALRRARRAVAACPASALLLEPVGEAETASPSSRSNTRSRTAPEFSP